MIADLCPDSESRRQQHRSYAHCQAKNAIDDPADPKRFHMWWYLLRVVLVAKGKASQP